MEIEIDRLIDEIISKMNPNWPNLYKIRYIYIELGKKLSKDTDFFFSVDDKLGKDQLNLKEIKDIYENEFGRDFKVICKSSCSILKRAYEKIGINSKLIETTASIMTHDEEDELAINHWFLVVEDGENNYFMTLTPDLPYIKSNRTTRNFGSDIEYIRKGKDGIKYQVYKGNPIKHKKLTVDDLKVIDREIGYLKTKYQYDEKNQKQKDWDYAYDDVVFSMLKGKLSNNNFYYELLTYGTRFYKELIKFKGRDGRYIRLFKDNINTITDEEWNDWIKCVCKYVSYKIGEIIGYEINTAPTFESKDWNYEIWLHSLCSQLQGEIFNSLDATKEELKNYKINHTDFNYTKWSRELKKNFEFKNKNNFYDNILVLLDRTNALVNSVKNKDKNIAKLLETLGLHFIDKNMLYENSIDKNGHLSNSYIAKKFYKLFKQIFSCNITRTEFNDLEYSEQVFIIKEIITMMFPEVNQSNSSLLKNYDENYKTILNRIHIYPLKENETGEYVILFNVLGIETGDDYYFLYDCKKNTIEDINVLVLVASKKYNILSNRMKNRISVEDIEILNNKRR